MLKVFNRKAVQTLCKITCCKCGRSQVFCLDHDKKLTKGELPTSIAMLNRAGCPDGWTTGKNEELCPSCWNEYWNFLLGLSKKKDSEFRNHSNMSFPPSVPIADFIRSDGIKNHRKKKNRLGNS